MYIGEVDAMLATANDYTVQFSTMSIDELIAYGLVHTNRGTPLSMHSAKHTEWRAKHSLRDFYAKIHDVNTAREVPPIIAQHLSEDIVYEAWAKKVFELQTASATN